MKKFLVFLCAMFMGVASASTVNIDWDVDGTTYAQTTCEIGGDFVLPSTAPTKYGYHFVGWEYDVIYGSITPRTQTPTLSNPVYPVFRPLGNTVLRALGSGNKLITDSYDPVTGKITRRVGIKILKGTEGWQNKNSGDNYVRYTWGGFSTYPNETDNIEICSHFSYRWQWGTVYATAFHNSIRIGSSRTEYHFEIVDSDPLYPYVDTLEKWDQWLADQYANGTPVTVYYPLATPIEEDLVQ